MAQQARANVDEFLGHTINDQYRLLKIVGTGGMGGVYLAENTSTSEKVAVKLLHPDRQQKENLAKRFIREAQISSLLKHPNTISVYDYGQDPNTGALYLAMEYLDGKTLYRYVRERQQLDFLTASYITTNILSSLGNAHENGIIHRDLKPGNVMIMERPGQPNIVKVLDFGIAKIHDPGAFGGDITKRMTALTQFGEMLGTPHYMPPEQIRGQELSASADLYALGVIFFFMITGRRPFEDKEGIHVTIAQLTQQFPRLNTIPSCAGLPGSVQEFLDRIVKKEPKERFQNAREMSEALTRVTSEVQPPSVAAPPGALRNPATQNRPKLPLPELPNMSQLQMQAIRTLVPQAAGSAAARPVLPTPAKPALPTPNKPPSFNAMRSTPVARPQATAPASDPDLFDNEQATNIDGAAFSLHPNDIDSDLGGEAGTVPGVEIALDLQEENKQDDPLSRTMPDSGTGPALPSIPPLPPPKRPKPPPPPVQSQATLPEPTKLPDSVKQAAYEKREAARRQELAMMGPPTVSDEPSPLAITEQMLAEVPNSLRSNPTLNDGELPDALPNPGEDAEEEPQGSTFLRWVLLLLLFAGLASAGAVSTYFVIQSIRPPVKTIK